MRHICKYMLPLRDVKLCTHFLSLFTNMSKVAPVNVKQFMTLAKLRVIIINHTKYSLSYLSQIFNLPFTNIVFLNTSTGEIEKIIHSFPWKNSCGYDEISMKILKISAPFISSLLCRIINIWLNSGVSPTRLKYSIITPLHKKVDKNNVTNYRPISLLTSFSKIF